MSAQLSEELKAEIMVKCPEIFSTKKIQDKYKMAEQLLKEKGISSSSLRDQFSAGGKFTYEGQKIPHVHGVLMKCVNEVKNEISIFSPEQKEQLVDNVVKDLPDGVKQLFREDLLSSIS